MLYYLNSETQVSEICAKNVITLEKEESPVDQVWLL